MKKIIFALFFLCFSYSATAQNEFYIPWNDSFSVDGASHIVDENGNLYILGTLFPFDTLEGYPIYAGTYGNALIKIDKNNAILWRNKYNIFYLGTQILFRVNSIFVPYNLYIGLSTCSTLLDTVGGVIDTIGYSAMESSINAGLLINNITGDTINNLIFYDGKYCGTETGLYSYIDKNENIYNFYYDDSFMLNLTNGASPAYIQKIDSNFNIVSDTLSSSLNQINNDNNEVSTILYDSIAENYIIGDLYGIQIYNNAWELLSVYDFRSFDLSFRGLGYMHISYNSNYYAINCSLTIDSFGDVSYYTIVLAKDGHLVSCQPSLYFNDIFLTNDNNIFGISCLNTADTINQPLTMEEMDLYQNVKRKVLLGKPGVMPNKISVTNNNEVIVTGTVYFTGMVDSFPRPDVIYYYRQAIDEIPLLTNNNNLCNSVSVYPNPTQNTVNITSEDYNSTYNATADMYDLLGQKMSSAVFGTKTLSFDLTTHPAGIYLLKIRNGSMSCVSKIQKK